MLCLKVKSLNGLSCRSHVDLIFLVLLHIKYMVQHTILISDRIHIISIFLRFQISMISLILNFQDWSNKDLHSFYIISLYRVWPPHLTLSVL